MPSYGNASGSGTFSGTSVVIDISSAPVGATIYVGILIATTESGGISWTPNVFTTLFDADESTASHYGIFRYVKQSGDTTFTASWATSNHGVYAWASYTGQDSTTADEQASVLLTTTATCTTWSLTPSGANEWALVFFFNRSTTGSQVPDFTGAPVTGITLRETPTYNAATRYEAGAVGDSNGAITVAAHQYSASSTNGTHGGAILLFLMPAVTNPTLAESGSAGEFVNMSRTHMDAGTATDALSVSIAVGTTPTLSDSATVIDALTASGQKWQVESAGVSESLDLSRTIFDS